MAEPTKEELELMMRMILGKKYDPDFDPRTLGKREDAAVGPSPDWNPKDTNVRMGDHIKYPFRLTSNPSKLSWALFFEKRKKLRDEEGQSWDEFMTAFEKLDEAMQKKVFSEMDRKGNKDL